MPKQTINDLGDLTGQKVFVRVDFNVPLTDDGTISNDRRIRGALPTIQALLQKGAAVVLMSHLGRPKGDPKKDAAFTMNRVATRLGELLGRPVKKLDEVVGPTVRSAVTAMKAGDVIVLENMRFHPGEQAGNYTFAGALAELADVYVNDAFGTCHRQDASMLALPEEMLGKPRVVGLLVAKELEILDNLLSAPKKPFVSVMGGAKVSDKIGFIEALLSRVDHLLIGGAMTYTFLKAQGIEVGNSKCEADKLDLAKELLAKAGGKLVLPVDHVCAEKPDGPTTIAEGAVPAGLAGFDIGPKTIAKYTAIIKGAATVVWNGPVGFFEKPPFDRGTKAIAEALAACPGVTVVGGGETAEAVEAFGLDTKMRHVSTGGGAFLEYVEGANFAALAAIEDK